MAPMETKPHIIVVPGACHVPYHWRLFKASMEKAGYGVTVQRLLANVEDDSGPLHDALSRSAAAVRAAVINQIGQGRDVVVIGHSAGGAIIGPALIGLGKIGTRPGVLRAVYLAAFLLGPGESFASKTQGNEPPYFTVRDGFYTCHEPKEWLYNDVPDDIAKDAACHLVRCSRTMSEDVVDAVSWHEIPAVYVVCEKDKALPPAIAEWVIAAAGVSWDIARIEASHSPFLSMPDRLAAVIRWAAGEENGDLEGVRFDDKKIDAEKAAQEAGWTTKTMAEVEMM